MQPRNLRRVLYNGINFDLAFDPDTGRLVALAAHGPVVSATIGTGISDGNDLSCCSKWINVFIRDPIVGSCGSLVGIAVDGSGKI